ncbi:MAG TPA: hypothetical protein VFK43_16320 [Acidimicrobiales bacterium]|nr:hypothetical protein [Acidimicrobiales bacterium]
MPPRLGLLAASLALAGGLVGCGGGGVSRAEFVTKADGACSAGNGMLAIAAKPSNLPELATAAGAVATSVDSQAEALRKLKAPGDDTAVVAGVIDALAGVGGQARALQEAAGKTDDAATARAANDLRGKTDNAASQAKAYGLTVCGQGLQAPVANVLEGGRTILKAAFVARAESLCTAANRKVDALASGSSLASLARYLSAYLPIADKLFADIKALAVPPGDDSAVADMLSAQDQALAKEKEAHAAAQRGNAAQFDRLEGEVITLVTAANAKFDAYGLRACGTLSNF